MEIERKFLISKSNLPANLSSYPHDDLEQAYIITEPVLRIRRQNNTYVLTCKGHGLMKREEAEFSLTRESYEKLLAKVEGNTIVKTRYRIPEKNNLTIELDIFHGLFEGIYLAEVEFPDEESALSYNPPTWFGKDVTNEITFHNSMLSEMDTISIDNLIAALSGQMPYSLI